jgi:hypothetical protein
MGRLVLFLQGDIAAAFLGRAFIILKYGSRSMPLHAAAMTAVAVTVAVSRVFI